MTRASRPERDSDDGCDGDGNGEVACKRENFRADPVTCGDAPKASLYLRFDLALVLTNSRPFTMECARNVRGVKPGRRRGPNGLGVDPLRLDGGRLGWPRSVVAVTLIARSPPGRGGAVWSPCQCRRAGAAQ